MSITRHFLGWDGPALQRAAGYLRDQLGQGTSQWNLGHVLAVVPAQRAGRRLLELLVTMAQSEDQALVPPNIVTTGHLPEMLYEPRGALAGDLDEHLAWVQTLRSMPDGTLADLLPHPPAENDLPGWWAFVTQLRRLRDDLAGHRMRFSDVPRLCAQRGADLHGESRWVVLDAIEQAYLRTLDLLHLVDRNEQRLNAINDHHCTLDESTHVVLIATPDLNDIAAAMLRQVGKRITSLVMAPQMHAEGFDDLGVLRATYWQSQQVELDAKQVRFVGRNTDQAQAVVEMIAKAQQEYTATGKSLSVDHITIGLGDERFAGVVRRRLDMAGVPCRHAAGTPTVQSRPALLLRALGRFMEEHRFDALAELLRHPDLETYLQHASDKDSRPAIEDWLTLLDNYATEHLQGRLTDQWLGKEDRRLQLKDLHHRVTALLPNHPAERKALPLWSEPIAQALQAVYADATLREHVRDEHQLALALEQIADLLREQGAFDSKALTCPQVTASQAIALILRRLTDNVLPDEHDGPAVEMLGYLELALDDAPVLAITGVNEGLIPSSRSADAFLPDSVRSALSMRDNRHRYARDLMLLNAITHSRPTVQLIAARRTDEGDPLKPSRLLLACDDQTLVKRVQSFFDDEPQASALALPISSGGTNHFLIPKPILAPRPLDTLAVTGFRAYLACPYRFYLKYVQRLAGLDDKAIEMDPLSFGSIAHHIFQAFGSSDLRDATNANAIAAFLNKELDRTMEMHFGEDRRPAIRIQTEQLRQRLNAFADQQIILRNDGWRIEHIEQDLNTTILVDGQPFTIKGKIDRIDRHDTLGWRIYDYKTSESGDKPEKTHHTGRKDNRTWIDLQLPLYRDLVTQLNITDRVELGYFNLPKKLDKVGPCMAEWDDDDLASASTMRDQVIRDLRQQCYWPPKDYAGFPDGLERICADEVMQRGELIELSNHAGGEV